MFGFGEQKFNGRYTEGLLEENRQSILVAARGASRSWTARIMTLSSTIIAFSVSVASLSVFQTGIDIHKLSLAWNFFLAALIVGAFNLLFESRVAYAVTWVEKKIEVRSTPSVKIHDWLKTFILFPLILLYPTFSIKNSFLKFETAYILVHYLLYKSFGLVFLLEAATFILFIIGLFSFLHAFSL